MIIGIWGDDKTCKTTFALTAPKKLAHMEFDIGGYDRAKHRFKEAISTGDIITEHEGHELRYVMPFQYGDMSDLNLVRPSKIVVGMKELFFQFLSHYMKLVNDPEIATIVIDTGTLLWEVCSSSVLQEKQELQFTADGNLKPGQQLRTSLNTFEYREPNIRMRGVMYQAKANRTNLIITHHSTDQYGPVLRGGEVKEEKTGKKERKGWNTLGDSADVIVHTFLKEIDTSKDDTPIMKLKPHATIDLAECIDLVGVELRIPTYDKVAKLVEMSKLAAEGE